MSAPATNRRSIGYFPSRDDGTMPVTGEGWFLARDIPRGIMPLDGLVTVFVKCSVCLIKGVLCIQLNKTIPKLSKSKHRSRSVTCAL